MKPLSGGHGGHRPDVPGGIVKRVRTIVSSCLAMFVVGALAMLAGARPFAQGPPQAASLVITGGTVLTVDDQRRVLSPGAARDHQ